MERNVTKNNNEGNFPQKRIFILTFSKILQPSFCITNTCKTQLQRRFKEHVGNKDPVKFHYENCHIAVKNQQVRIIGTRPALFVISPIWHIYIIQLFCVFNKRTGYTGKAMEKAVRATSEQKNRPSGIFCRS